MANKKTLSKEELRRAMLEAKKKRSYILNSFNTYNELDQLTCILCKLVVRNEAVWPVHLNSRSHKDNVALAKKMKEQASLKSQPVIFKKPEAVKRPSTFQQPQPPKKIKGILKNSGHASTHVEPALPADFFESPPTINRTLSLPKAKLENGSQDSNEIKPQENVEVESQDVVKSALPEGFFDDPKLDAKVRNVEYKDPIEEEWERFQKEIKEETAQSAQIIGDDQEEAATERQFDTVEEQLRHCDEDDFDEFLDWRAKKSYRE
ncbi:hypothetical protein QAD02_005218 [Eretmocerus hayati]|uniref:Uncharacterized protein n=1 Tax=Eretmocerus hayati TaxID=131215 RepID=A0ACC2NS36_9HYME|nr:hypothetical protein QAD02_005218 [Eretmocerus hayati]